MRIPHALRATTGAALLTACATAGAGRDPIVTDRPDFTESTETVPEGMVQVEGGYTFASVNGVRSHAVGEILGRVATGRRSELRVGLNSYTVESSPRGSDSGLEDASIGAKLKLVAAGDRFELLRPNVSIIALTSLPTGGGPSHVGVYQPGTKLALSWTVSERIGLSSNVNYEYAGDDGNRSHEFAASTSLGIALSDRVGGYAEYFRLMSSSGAGTDFLNGGLTLLVHPDLQLDARVGAAVITGSEYFVGLGASRRW